MVEILDMNHHYMTLQEEPKNQNKRERDRAMGMGHLKHHSFGQNRHTLGPDFLACWLIGCGAGREGYLTTKTSVLLLALSKDKEGMKWEEKQMNKI